MKVSAIILAAGSGKRMQSDIPKQYILLNGKPVLYYSLKVMEESFADEIILVVGAGETAYCQEEIVKRYDFRKVKKIVEGGKERYHSVYNGLAAAEKTDYVMIHDGARPFLTQQILCRLRDAFLEYQACAVGMPVKDTIKIADENRFSSHTPDRSCVWQIQTPQAFSYPLIKKAYETLFQFSQIEKMGITDDAMVLETALHKPVRLVKGSYENIKITTPEDMKIAEVLLKNS